MPFCLVGRAEQFLVVFLTNWANCTSAVHVLSLVSSCGWVLNAKYYACRHCTKNYFSISVTTSLSHNLTMSFILVQQDYSQSAIIMGQTIVLLKVFPVTYDLPKTTFHLIFSC